MQNFIMEIPLYIAYTEKKINQPTLSRFMFSNNKIKTIKNFLQNRHKYFNLLSHWGFKYKCPFCDFHSKDLLPIGIDNPTIRKYQIIGAGQRNAGCPKCGSTDRERLVYTYLKYESSIFGKPLTRILHIAPEMIIANQFVAHGFKKYICGDFYAEGQHSDYSKDFVKPMDVQNLPFADNSFDLIICNHVLKHVYDEKKAIQELFRVLAKGGQAILQVPFSPILDKTISDPTITDKAILEEEFGQKDHVRLFGTDYRTILETYGFNVQILKLHKRYTKFGFNPKEPLYIGKK